MRSRLRGRAQRHQRLRAGRRQGGEQRRQECCREAGGRRSDELPGPQRQRRGGEVARPEVGHRQAAEEQAGADPEPRAGETEHPGLGEEEAEHLTRAGAGGAQQADLPAPLADGERRGVGADPRADQAREGDDEEEQRPDLVERRGGAGTRVDGEGAAAERLLDRRRDRHRARSRGEPQRREGGPEPHPEGTRGGGLADEPGGAGEGSENLPVSATEGRGRLQFLENRVFVHLRFDDIARDPAALSLRNLDFVVPGPAGQHVPAVGFAFEPRISRGAEASLNITVAPANTLRMAG